MRSVLEWWRWIAVGVVAVPAIVSTQEKSLRGVRMDIEALSPVDVIADRVQEVSSLAVAPDGGILLASRAHGTLIRIDERGRPSVLLDTLHAPSSIASEPDGAVLIVDQGGGRLLRYRNGHVAIASSGVTRIRAVAVGNDGRVWLVVRGRATRGRADKGASGDDIVRLDESGALVAFASHSHRGFIECAA
jgi:hypothetical protein